MTERGVLRIAAYPRAIVSGSDCLAGPPLTRLPRSVSGYMVLVETRCARRAGYSVRHQAKQRAAAKMTATMLPASHFGSPNDSGLICIARVPKKKKPAPNTHSPSEAQYRIPAN
jgi:hypothetical protein